MKDLFINKCFNFVNSNQNLDHYNQVKIKYGLEVLYHFITKTFTILLLSYLLGILKQNLLIFIFYGLLRINCHGIHAKSNLSCWISSIFVYLVLGYYIKSISINYIVFISTSIISIFSFLLWSPSDTIKRPLIHKEDRLKLKIKTLIIAFLEMLFAIFFPFFRKHVLFAFILSSVVINPFVYHIIGATRNNYINYKEA